MKIKILEVVTPLSIYHGCSTWKMFWEGNFTGEKKFTLCEFIAMNKESCGRQNVRKNREIKVSDKYVKLEISLKFGSLEKMIITSSDPKDNLVRSGKGLINYLGLKANTIPKK